MTKAIELKQNDFIHKYALSHVGSKMGEGIHEELDIFYAEEDGNAIHVVGNGLRYDGETYDFWQSWIPKSICRVRFGVFGYKSMVWFPMWATIKIYSMKQEKAEYIANLVETAFRKAELERLCGGGEHDDC